MADTRWFTEAKFGLFVHFGLYSIPGGVWNCRPIGRNACAEWIRWNHGWPDPTGIPKNDYDALLAQFNPTHFDADALCRAAAAAGMRYFVLTTKHHDGFALWPSRVSDYSMARTPSKRDLVGEMTTAARHVGMKVGFYYSHWLDWDYSGGGLPPWPEIDADPVFEQPADDAFEEYWSNKALPQVAELIADYQPDLFWFDSWGQRTRPQLSPNRLDRLIRLIREQSPHTLINSRIGTEEGVDYLSMGDNIFPNQRNSRPWETSATMNHSWGYSSIDTRFRSTTEILRLLIDNVSRGGNLQLNVGPMGDGTIEPAARQRLDELAVWMNKNGGALHGIGMVNAEEPTWGRLLGNDEQLYAFVYDRPAGGTLALPKLDRPVRAGQCLSENARLVIETIGSHQLLRLGDSMPENAILVIRLQY